MNFNLRKLIGVISILFAGTFTGTYTTPVYSVGTYNAQVNLTIRIELEPFVLFLPIKSIIDPDGTGGASYADANSSINAYVTEETASGSLSTITIYTFANGTAAPTSSPTKASFEVITNYFLFQFNPVNGLVPNESTATIMGNWLVGASVADLTESA